MPCCESMAASVESEGRRSHASSGSGLGGSTNASHIPHLTSRADAQGVQLLPNSRVQAMSTMAKMRYSNDKLLDANLELTKENIVLQEKNEDITKQLKDFKAEQTKLLATLRKEIDTATRISKDSITVTNKLRKEVETTAKKYQDAIDETKKVSEKYEKIRTTVSDDLEFYAQVVMDMQDEILKLGGKPQFVLCGHEPWKTMRLEKNQYKNHNVWVRMKQDKLRKRVQEVWETETSSDESKPRRKKRTRK